MKAIIRITGLLIVALCFSFLVKSCHGLYIKSVENDKVRMQKNIELNRKHAIWFRSLTQEQRDSVIRLRNELF